MIKRGVIPLLMDIAKAGIGRPSIKAMERLDDCGLVLVKKGLLTQDAEMFSATALLVLHLLWDEEWAEPLSSIEPGVALKTIRWGLFAMNSIIERAEDRKKERKAMVAKFHELNQKTWRLDDGDEEERARREADEVVSKLRGGSDQLVQCGGLSLLSSCIDIPIRETQSAVITAMRNAFLLGTDAIIPSNFNDPAHLVRALLSSFVHVKPDDYDLMIMMSEAAGRLKAVPIWAPSFDQLPALCKTLSQIVPPIYEGLSERPEDVHK
eukprot:scaffold5361_cov83-Skeletonema_dohrnii-CCMP3373.AAC.2